MKIALSHPDPFALITKLSHHGWAACRRRAPPIQILDVGLAATVRYERNTGAMIKI